MYSNSQNKRSISYFKPQSDKDYSSLEQNMYESMSWPLTSKRRLLIQILINSFKLLLIIIPAGYNLPAGRQVYGLLIIY